MKMFLESEGFEVESFESAQEANFAITGGTASMVIMGLAFADADGEDFLSRTVRSFRGPVIVVSASVDEYLEEKFISLGVRAAIKKSGPWKENLRQYLSEIK